MKGHSTKKSHGINTTAAGYGMWYLLHRMAFNAKTDTDKRLYYDTLVWMSLNHDCEDCRNHIKTMLVKHPIGLYWKMVDPAYGRDIGVFKHSHVMHNDVNARLGKPTLDFETAYNTYNGGKKCESCKLTITK